MVVVIDSLNKKVKKIDLSTNSVTTLYTFTTAPQPKSARWSLFQDYIMVSTTVGVIWKLMYPSGTISAIAGGGNKFIHDNK
jgi:DNA-binding beta-propeller fold protein YncE